MIARTYIKTAKQNIINCIAHLVNIWGYHILEFNTYSKQMTSSKDIHIPSSLNTYMANFQEFWL